MKEPRAGRLDNAGTSAGWRLSQCGAITVEYALVMVLAAAILIGIEEDVFRPMAKEILKSFMDFIVKPYP